MQARSSISPQEIRTVAAPGTLLLHVDMCGQCTNVVWPDLADGGFIEITERVLEVHGTLEMTKYRHHWQDGNGVLIKRWDNAPHHPTIDTFPHHLHDGAEDCVVSHQAISGLEALRRILAEVEAREISGGGEA